MYLICLVHSIGYVDSRWTHPLVNISFAGVIGFVLISGYCGIRFTWFKVLKLESTALYCAAFVTLMGEVVFRCSSSPITFTSCIFTTISIWKSYWFVHAYVILMCFAALVPDVGNTRESRSRILSVSVPVIVAVYGWSFLMLIPCIQEYIPRTAGLESFGGITLFAAYLVGRIFRIYEMSRKMQIMLYIAAITCGVLSAFSGKCGLNWGGALARYNTPTLLLLALGMFNMFLKIPYSLCNSKFCGVAIRVAMPVLPVYLLHCNPYGYRVLAIIEDVMPSDCFCLNYLIIALIVFLCCVLLDMPRRLLGAICHKLLRK